MLQRQTKGIQDSNKWSCLGTAHPFLEMRRNPRSGEASSTDLHKQPPSLVWANAVPRHLLTAFPFLEMRHNPRSGEASSTDMREQPPSLVWARAVLRNQHTNSCFFPRDETQPKERRGQQHRLREHLPSLVWANAVPRHLHTNSAMPCHWQTHRAVPCHPHVSGTASLHGFLMCLPQGLILSGLPHAYEG